MKLTRQITIAFLVLAFVMSVAAGISFYYLDGIHSYQAQFEDEWEEYQRMESTEEALKEFSTDISAWEAGILPVAQLKLRINGVVKTLSFWTNDTDQDEQQSTLTKNEKSEAKLFSSARGEFLELIRIIGSLPNKPTAATSAALIETLKRLRQASVPLRQLYLENLQKDLSKVRKYREKAQRQSFYFVLVVGLLITFISIYSVKVLRRQAKQIMEQERQIASVELVKTLGLF